MVVCVVAAGRMAILSLITDGLVAAMVLAAPLGPAILVVDALGGRRWPRLEHLAVSLVLGVSLLSVTLQVLGLAGVLDRTVWVAILGGCGLTTLVMVYRRYGQQSARTDSPALRSDTTASAGWLGILTATLGPFLALAVLAAAIPPGVLWYAEAGGYDALEYHLQGPREYLSIGHIEYLPHNVYTNFPFAAEMLYLLAMILRGDVYVGAYLAQMLHVGLGVLAVLTVYATGRLWSTRAGVVAAVTAGTCPWVAYVAGLAYVELGLLATTAAAVYVAMRMLQQDGSNTPLRSALLAGLLCGAACGFKYTAIPLVVMPVGVMAAWAVWRHRNGQRVRRVMLAGGGFAAGVVVMFGVYLARTAAWTSNPVFPLATTVFGDEPFTEPLAERWREGHTLRDDQRGLDGRLRALYEQALAQPMWAVACSGDATHRNMLLRSHLRTAALYGPLVWLLPVAGIVAGRRQPAVWMLVMMVGVQILFWMWGTHLQGRFLMTAIVPLSIVAGVLAARRLRPWQTAAVAAAILTGVAGNATHLWVLFDQHCRGRTSQRISWYGAHQALRTGMLRHTEHLEVINTQLPADATVLLVGEARAFYFREPLRYRTVFNHSELAEAADDGATGAARWLRQAGIDYVYVDFVEVSRLRRTYGFEEQINRNLFSRLVHMGALQIVDAFGPTPDGPGRVIYKVLR